MLAPGYAAAYVGLADCYNLGPEFGGMRPADAYPRARSAALRAIQLAPASADAHRALAFVDFWWRQDPALGLTEMRKAERLAPRSALTHHWLANMLAARGDPDALREINLAAELEPDTAVLADKGLIQIMLGRLTEAEALLRQVSRLQPDYVVARDYLVLLARRRGDEAEALRQTRLAELRHDEGRAAAAAKAERLLASGRRESALETLAAAESRLLSSGESDSFDMALLQSDLRRRGATLAWLARARAEHHPAILSLPTNPDFAWLRSDAAFRRLLT